MGRHLDLADQFDYTNGGCSIFAIAAQRVVGGRLFLLHAADPRTFEIHDWPVDEPLCLHVFIELDDGQVVDAEGARPMDAMLVDFGVRRGWDYRVESTDVHGVQATFRPAAGYDECVDDLERTLRECEWDLGVPSATGELGRRYEEAKALSSRRQEERRAISPAPRP